MGVHAAIVVGLVLYVVLTTAVSFFWMSRVRKPADYSSEFATVRRLQIGDTAD